MQHSPKLLDAVRAGRVDATKTFILRYKSVVRGSAIYAIKYTDSWHVPAEDLIQGVWVALLQRNWVVLGRFDPNKNSFRGWLKVVAFRKARKLIRIWDTRSAGEQPVIQPIAGTQISPARQLQLRAAWQAVEKELTAPELAHLRMHMLGHRGEEIAQFLGIGETAARKRLSRLRDKLKRRLSESTLSFLQLDI